MRDPHVRIKIGDKLYDRTLVLVTDPAEMDAVLQVREKKYPQLKIPANCDSTCISRRRLIGILNEDRHHRRQ